MPVLTLITARYKCEYPDATWFLGFVGDNQEFDAWYGVHNGVKSIFLVPDPKKERKTSYNAVFSVQNAYGPSREAAEIAHKKRVYKPSSY